jgi:hypothetical protein
LSSCVAISIQRRALLRAVVCKIISMAFDNSVSTDDVILSFEVKCRIITGHEGPEGEEGYSSTRSLTLALDGVGGQRHAPAALPLVKSRYLFCRRLGGPQSRSGRVRTISPPPGFDHQTVQPVASRYTDCAVSGSPSFEVLVVKGRCVLGRGSAAPGNFTCNSRACFCTEAPRTVRNAVNRHWHYMF